MEVFIERIGCPICGGFGMDVQTSQGNKDYLFDGDVCICPLCGSEGWIEADDEVAICVTEEDYETAN